MRSLALLLLLSLAPTADAQPRGEANREAMKKLAFLAGKWKGEAKIKMGPGEPTPIKQVESVQSKLNGTVLLVEGTGTGKIPGTDKEGVVFNALGVIAYDAEAKKYTIRAYRAEGVFVDADVKLTEKGFDWGFTVPGQKIQVRYSMTLTPKGEWNEVGESSFDGKTWNKFFEMTLTREKE